MADYNSSEFVLHSALVRIPSRLRLREVTQSWGETDCDFIDRVHTVAEFLAASEGPEYPLVIEWDFYPHAFTPYDCTDDSKTPEPPSTQANPLGQGPTDSEALADLVKKYPNIIYPTQQELDALRAEDLDSVKTTQPEFSDGFKQHYQDRILPAMVEHLDATRDLAERLTGVQPKIENPLGLQNAGVPTDGLPTAVNGQTKRIDFASECGSLTDPNLSYDIETAPGGEEFGETLADLVKVLNFSDRFRARSRDEAQKEIDEFNRDLEFKNLLVAIGVLHPVMRVTWAPTAVQECSFKPEPVRRVMMMPAVLGAAYNLPQADPNGIVRDLAKGYIVDLNRDHDPKKAPDAVIYRSPFQTLGDVYYKQSDESWTWFYVRMQKALEDTQRTYPEATVEFKRVDGPEAISRALYKGAQSGRIPSGPKNSAKNPEVDGEDDPYQSPFHFFTDFYWGLYDFVGEMKYVVKQGALKVKYAIRNITRQDEVDNLNLMLTEQRKLTFDLTTRLATAEKQNEKMASKAGDFWKAQWLLNNAPMLDAPELYRIRGLVTKFVYINPTTFAKYSCGLKPEKVEDGMTATVSGCPSKFILTNLMPPDRILCANAEWPAL